MYDVLSKRELYYSPSDWIEITAEDSSMDDIARDLANELTSLTLPESVDQRCRFILRVNHCGISLQDVSQPKTNPFFLEKKGLNRRSVGRDLLAKAIGRRCRYVVDATAGFGRDAFHLFHLGKNVTAIERSPVIAMMLADAIKRLAVPSPEINFQMVCQDARRWLSECKRPDVVYLDPMFPDRKSRSTLAAKELRLLRSLVGEDEDAADLLLVARSVALQRVVVKRPIHAPILAGIPSLEYKGRTVRYDVYLTSYE